MRTKVDKGKGVCKTHILLWTSFVDWMTARLLYILLLYSVVSE